MSCKDGPRGRGSVAGDSAPSGRRRARVCSGDAAHRRADTEGAHDFTDDAGLAEWAGLPVKLVASSGQNMKLTTAQDPGPYTHLTLPTILRV